MAISLGANDLERECEFHQTLSDDSNRILKRLERLDQRTHP